MVGGIGGGDFVRVLYIWSCEWGFGNEWVGRGSSWFLWGGISFKLII